MLYALRFFFHDMQCFHCSSSSRRSIACAEDIRSGVMPQIVYHSFIGSHETAYRSQRFGECTHYDIHIAGYPEMVASATSLIAEDSESVSFIHHYACIIHLCQTHNLWEVSQIAFHAEHAVHYYKFHTRWIASFQLAFKSFHVIMLELQGL